MAASLFHKLTATTNTSAVFGRSKTTSAQYVAARFRDPTFEKLMDKYKVLHKVISIQDLILASREDPPSVSLEFLDRLSQRLHLNRGPASFLRNHPHVFHIFNHPAKLKPYCTLTPKALGIIRRESESINQSLPLNVLRLVKILSMSLTKRLPLRAVFKVWKELGLPDDFEESVIEKNKDLFVLRDGNEVNTHYLELVDGAAVKEFQEHLVPAIENWRVVECCKEDCDVESDELRFGFKQGFPSGMRLKKNFKKKVKEWQRVPYTGPYDGVEGLKGALPTKKRAVGIVHEFLSLTVEKMVEVEKISHFRKWFGIELNMRDLFLDHPGIFYLSTKGGKHSVFLREAYERGRLVDSNSVYESRMAMLDLVVMGKRGFDRVGEANAVQMMDED